MAHAANTIFLMTLMTLAAAKPIMVSFGTHQGPIQPPTERPQRPAPRNIEPRDPAPVSEETEDVPNPHFYRAPVPKQYRNRIYIHRPPADLALGTPIDQKYTPSQEKLEPRDGTIGVGYTGPHAFDRQEYEVEENREKGVRYIKPEYYQEKLQERQRKVPQIGIVYSSGVRYYVPQLVYVDHKREEEEENSVYDSKNEKYLYRKGQ